MGIPDNPFEGLEDLEHLGRNIIAEAAGSEPSSEFLEVSSELARIHNGVLRQTPRDRAVFYLPNPDFVRRVFVGCTGNRNNIYRVIVNDRHIIFGGNETGTQEERMEIVDLVVIPNLGKIATKHSDSGRKPMEPWPIHQWRGPIIQLDRETEQTTAQIIAGEYYQKPRPRSAKTGSFSTRRSRRERAAQVFAEVAWLNGLLPALAEVTFSEEVLVVD